MAKHRILLYTLSGETSQAERLLDEWGVANQVELSSQTHEPFVPPAPETLEGVEAVCGEFMPVRSPEVVELFATAGVRLIASMSIGLNHMDLDALKRAGILVTNCPGYCAEDVALHAVALMLDLERQVTFLNREVMDGVWEPKDGYPMHRTHGQTLGLVFFGHISKAVVPMARGLGMKVLVWAPTKTAAEIEAAGASKAETLDELLASSDVVSLHCPLIPMTEHLIDAKALATMKEGAFLVNTARGDVVDEEALLAALDSGHIRGAGLDTLHAETSHRNEALVRHPRVIVTPHCAYNSVESQERLIEMTLADCVDLVVRGKRPAHVVD